MFADGLAGISRWRRMLCARTCPLDSRAAAGGTSRLAYACRVGIARRRVRVHPACSSPAFGDCHGLPRTLFILAEYDGLRLEGEFYAKKLLSAGVPVRVLRYRGVCHGFFDALGILPQSEAAANEIAGLLNDL